MDPDESFQLAKELYGPYYRIQKILEKPRSEKFTKSLESILSYYETKIQKLDPDATLEEVFLNSLPLEEPSILLGTDGREISVIDPLNESFSSEMSSESQGEAPWVDIPLTPKEDSTSSFLDLTQENQSQIRDPVDFSIHHISSFAGENDVEVVEENDDPSLDEGDWDIDQYRREEGLPLPNRTPPPPPPSKGKQHLTLSYLGMDQAGYTTPPRNETKSVHKSFSDSIKRANRSVTSLLGNMSAIAHRIVASPQIDVNESHVEDRDLDWTDLGGGGINWSSDEEEGEYDRENDSGAFQEGHSALGSDGFIHFDEPPERPQQRPSSSLLSEAEQSTLALLGETPELDRFGDPLIPFQRLPYDNPPPSVNYYHGDPPPIDLGPSLVPSSSSSVASGGAITFDNYDKPMGLTSHPELWYTDDGTGLQQQYHDNWGGVALGATAVGIGIAGLGAAYTAYKHYGVKKKIKKLFQKKKEKKSYATKIIHRKPSSPKEEELEPELVPVYEAGASSTGGQVPRPGPPPPAPPALVEEEVGAQLIGNGDGGGDLLPVDLLYGETPVLPGGKDDLKMKKDRGKYPLALPDHLGEDDLTLMASYDSRKGLKSSLWESKRNKDGKNSTRSKYWKHRTKDQTWERVSRAKRIQYMARGRRGYKPHLKKHWGKKMSEMKKMVKSAGKPGGNSQDTRRLQQLIAQKTHYRKDIIKANVGQALLTSRKK